MAAQVGAARGWMWDDVCEVWLVSSADQTNRSKSSRFGKEIGWDVCPYWSMYFWLSWRSCLKEKLNFRLKRQKLLTLLITIFCGDMSELPSLSAVQTSEGSPLRADTEVNFAWTWGQPAPTGRNTSYTLFLDINYPWPYPTVYYLESPLTNSKLKKPNANWEWTRPQEQTIFLLALKCGGEDTQPGIHNLISSAREKKDNLETP